MTKIQGLLGGLSLVEDRHLATPLHKAAAGQSNLAKDRAPHVTADGSEFSMAD